jgi:hypothetical protein
MRDNDKRRDRRNRHGETHPRIESPDLPGITSTSIRDPDPADQ